MRILVIDDNKDSLNSLGLVLRDMGHTPTLVHDPREGLRQAENADYPLVISDIKMPTMSGVELLQHIKNNPACKNTDVVLITGYADMDSAVAALRLGAYDYLHKPINAVELSGVVERSADRHRLLEENKGLKEHLSLKEEESRKLDSRLEAARKQLREVYGVGQIVAESSAMLKVMRESLIFHGNPSVPVMIEGETGTGKEIVARLIHYGEDFNLDTPFVALNCTAIPHELFGSELFGYEQGAFTGGKTAGSAGKLELAANGTLFLDEIADMPFDMQPKLLRVLEERAFYRIGGKKLVKFNARIICAGNRSLARLVEQGRFRRDLYHRLSVGHVYLPPLRERLEELEPMATMFLRQEAASKKKRFTRISPLALALMRAYPWLGNIRELRNAIERAVLLYDGEELLPEHLDFLQDHPGHVYAEHISQDTGYMPWIANSAVNPELVHQAAPGASDLFGNGESQLVAGSGIPSPAFSEAPALPSELHAPACGQTSSSESSMPAMAGDGQPITPNPVNAEAIVLPEDSLDIEALYDVIVLKAIEKFQGNKSRAADYLGISRFALYRRLKAIETPSK